MDIRDGRIYASRKDIKEEDLPFCMEMAIPPTETQLKNRKIARNDICPCGSNKKFKKCCMRDFEDK